MATIRHDIAERDVVALRAPEGDRGPGTKGTAVITYEDAGGAARHLVIWPADKVVVELWQRALDDVMRHLPGPV